jgi:hypothetical protein
VKEKRLQPPGTVQRNAESGRARVDGRRHCHDRDYVIVVLESDGGVVAEEKGGEHVSRGMKPGDVAFRQKGDVHRAVNKGRVRIETS